MKKLILTITTVPMLMLSGCDKINLENATIQAAVSTGTALAFRYVLTDPEQRTIIANYVSAIAGAARSISGNETPEELTKLLNARVPPDVLAQFPEIGTIVVPQVVGYYVSAREKFGADTVKLLARMNAVAAGLESGVASYITPKS